MNNPIKRRTMKRFTISEISGVRVPAQEGARAAIFKSADPPREAADPPRVEQSTMSQVQVFSKAEVGDALDKLAKSYASVNHVSFAKAYDEVLKTDIGAQLYAMSRIVEKAAPSPTKAAIADGIDALAREHATANGISVPKAYAAILASEAGKKLYAGMRAA